MSAAGIWFPARGDTPFVYDANAVLLYVISHGARDIPAGKYAVREQRATRGGVTMGPVYTADTLAAARLLVPPWAGFNVGRQPGDDAVIVEVWI